MIRKINKPDCSNATFIKSILNPSTLAKLDSWIVTHDLIHENKGIIFKSYKEICDLWHNVIMRIYP